MVKITACKDRVILKKFSGGPLQLSGWGRHPQIEALGCSFESISQLSESLKKPFDYIVHGMGRSYGDSALNHRVLFSNRFNKILNFDSNTGIITCESGVTLAELIDIFVARGWFLSVTPGTRFITIGGAIASDVHGKNHHKVGCFSESVCGFELMLPDGKILPCSKKENQEFFLATCGGMGLTGVILNVKLKMLPIKSAFIHETTIPVRNLDEAFMLFEQHKGTTYSVAWIDCLAKGSNFGRSVLFLGEHAETGGLNLPKIKKISIPFNMPGFFLNRFSARFFNWLYQQTKARLQRRLVSLDTFFYPLDRINNWNRLYGSRGFAQYQFVLPKESSFKGLQVILNKVAESGIGSFLGVLKLFGSQNENYLSFPIEGYTLALDFRIQNGLLPLFNELDHIVADFGGRLYLAKDFRMSGDIFRSGYPKWKKFAAIRERCGMNQKFKSLQSRRVRI